jgi:hypothetical protein
MSIETIANRETNTERQWLVGEPMNPYYEAYCRGQFHDIANPDHRRAYVETLINGRAGINESYGPYGVTVMLDLAGDMEEKRRRVALVGIIKAGRDMERKPPTIMITRETIDQIVDFEAMTRKKMFTANQLRDGITEYLLETGAFAEVALKPEFADLLPITKEVEVDGNRIRTGIVACVDESYPFLADIVRQGWEKGHVMAISSANRTGQPTETTPEGVWDIVKDKPFGVMILDNPALRRGLRKEGIEPCSYTILQATTGLSKDEDGHVVADLLRMGNVGPGRVHGGLRAAFGKEGLLVRSISLGGIQRDEKGRITVVRSEKRLVEKPFCVLGKEHPPARLRPALGLPTQEDMGNLNLALMYGVITEEGAQEIKSLPYFEQALAIRPYYLEALSRQEAKMRWARESNAALNLSTRDETKMYGIARERMEVKGNGNGLQEINDK